MRIFIAIMIAIALSTVIAQAQTPADHMDENVKFVAFDVFVDTGDRQLGAYQIEISDLSGRTRIVGVEGGEKEAAFESPPYYDEKALHGDGRIIIAAFTTDDDAPTGNSRVARLHMQIEGEQIPDFDVQLVVAADADGAELDAIVNVSKSEQ